MPGAPDCRPGWVPNGDCPCAGSSAASVALYLNRRLRSQAIHDLNAVNVALKSYCTTSVDEARIGAVYDLSAVLSTNRSEWICFQSTN